MTYHSAAPAAIWRVRLVALVTPKSAGAAWSRESQSPEAVGVGVALQSKRTGEWSSVAFTGDCSSGAFVGQLCGRGIVKTKCGESSDGQLSKRVCTNHSIAPLVSVADSDVCTAVPTSLNGAPFVEAKRR